MKTVLDINDALLGAAEAQAQATNRTLAEVIEDGLRVTLERGTSTGVARDFQLPAFGAGGLRPGVDLSDNAALHDIMDGIE